MGISISTSSTRATHSHETALHSTAHAQSPALKRDGLALYTANSLSQQRMAQQLVGRRYAARGYQYNTPIEANGANQTTLNASGPDGILGTLTLRFDSSLGLCADEVFGTELSALRRAERKVCEFTKLALDDELESQKILAALFHMAYIHAHRIRQCDIGVIEVNPRHIGYYQRMLGFKVCSELRTNLRVQAPAVLLCVEFEHIREQLNRFGGRPEFAPQARSLYPHAFSAEEERQMLGALLAEQPAHGALLS